MPYDGPVWRPRPDKPEKQEVVITVIHKYQQPFKPPRGMGCLLVIIILALIGHFTH